MSIALKGSTATIEGVEMPRTVYERLRGHPSFSPGVDAELLKTGAFTVQSLYVQCANDAEFESEFQAWRQYVEACARAAFKKEAP